MKKARCGKTATGLGVEAAGIAHASRDPSMKASTCVVGHLRVGLGAPTDRVPFGLSHHKFNPIRNGRLGSGEPAKSSPAMPREHWHDAAPFTAVRRRDGEKCQCWQLMV